MAKNSYPPEVIKSYLKGIGEWNKFILYFSEGRPFKEMFAEFWDRKDILRVLSLPQVNHELNEKNNQKSNKFRMEANRLYRAKNFEKALLAYNYAVMSASYPDGTNHENSTYINGNKNSSETLAISFGSRSALLFEVGQYEECLKDIERAVLYGYPSDKIYKLNERRKRCLDKRIGEKNNYKNEQEPKVDKYKYIFCRGTKCPEIMMGINREKYHMVNKCLEAEYSSSNGRHLVATGNIEPGEILMVERAICSIPKLDSSIRSYCCVCLRKAPIVIPCSTCSLMAFCGEDCRQSSNNNHEVECKLLPILITSRADEELGLVYRTLLKYTFEEIILTLEKDKGHFERKKMKGLLNSQVNYFTLRNLEGNILKRSSECYIETIANAIIIIHLLQRTPEFWYQKDVNKPRLDNDDDSLKTLGAEIMRLLLNYQCNIHCLKELQINTETNIINADCYETGYGIFNTFSLMNHSCAPNALHSNWGDIKFMYAITFIPKGEEIFDSYGERYVSHDIETRMRNLKKHYFFDCNCKACTEKWPMFDKLKRELELKCPKCQVALNDAKSTCEICKCVFILRKSKNDGRKKKAKESTHVYDSVEMFANIESAWEVYRTAYEEINRHKITMANLKKIGKYISLLSKYTCLPHALLVEAQESLLRGFDLMGSYTFLTPKI